MFHNTIQLTGNSLADATQKALSQDEIVLQFFRAHANIEYTPCEVHKMLVESQAISAMVPLTSIRRAMNTLTKHNKIFKTSNKKQGLLGAQNFTWILRREAVQLKLI